MKHMYIVSEKLKGCFCQKQEKCGEIERPPIQNIQ